MLVSVTGCPFLLVCIARKGKDVASNTAVDLTADDMIELNSEDSCLFPAFVANTYPAKLHETQFQQLPADTLAGHTDVKNSDAVVLEDTKEIASLDKRYSWVGVACFILQSIVVY